MDEEVVGAILAHAEWNQAEYPLDRPIRRALFVVDELCGFSTAVAYVRPERLAGLTAASVRNKMKQKSFAAAVKREDIERGAALLGLPLDDHIWSRDHRHAEHRPGARAGLKPARPPAGQCRPQKKLAANSAATP